MIESGIWALTLSTFKQMWTGMRFGLLFVIVIAMSDFIDFLKYRTRWSAFFNFDAKRGRVSCYLVNWLVSASLDL